MLKSLHIRNFAVIEDLCFETGPGLNVFTGETGAGKSILIEALGFVLGDRAGVDLVRPGASRMEVRAVFSSKALPAGLRKEHGMDGQDFVLKRELDARGRGRAFVDSSHVQISVLALMGEFMLDFHGQHEHQSLVRPSVHLELLDRYAGLEKLAAEAGELFRERQAVASKLDSVRLSAEEKERLLDLYRFQSGEINDAGLKTGEDSELEAVLPRIKNAEKLRGLCERAYELLYGGESSALESSGKAGRLVEELALLDPSLENTAGMLLQAAMALEEASSGLLKYKESLSCDPADIDACLSRLDRIARLKKKYGPEIKDILAFAENMDAKISDLENSGEKEQDIRASLSVLEKKLLSLCGRLHGKRLEGGKKLADRVLKEIKPLGLRDARFSVAVETEEGRFTPSGCDAVEFVFSPNPGQPLKPLRSIASGGEMSRVMLGLKSVLAAEDAVPVLVFDEVDAGVGAVVGRLVGEKLARLARQRQVLCVTHLPQVAAFGNIHFHVVKSSAKGTTAVSVERLEGEKRVGELARMLGGKKESSGLSVKHAEELLSECAG
ncbi:MAG: DNA repair protein RecN [bacterium]